LNNFGDLNIMKWWKKYSFKYSRICHYEIYYKFDWKFKKRSLL